jgi:signal transduction histidine kinase/ActR/RegA family two-component response regulator
MSRTGSAQALEAARWFVARSPLCMSLLDLEGRKLETSPASVELFARNTGIAPEIVKVLSEKGGTPEAHRQLLEGLAAGSPILEFENEHDGPSGRFFLRTQASYWRDDDGNPIAILIVHQDIGAEREARAAAEESQARLWAVVDNMPAQITLTDLESGDVVFTNAKMRAGLGMIAGSRLGASLSSLPKASLDYMMDCVAQAEAAGGVFATEATATEGPCAGHTFRIKYVLFRDRHGRRQLLWIGEDVTELRHVTTALEKAAAEAEAASRAKSEFLANMSHEIRTPLNGVMGVAGALAKTRLDANQHEMVEIIETSAKTLETLLSDILDLARIEAGKMELRPEPFDLAGSVKACAALFEAAAHAKGLDLHAEIEPAALGWYVGDAPRLRQILSNLLGNAVKFTNAGSIALRVTAEPGPAASRLRFEVRDTGIGFDAETKARLFSRFEQADGSITRRFGGTGLGLAISRSLAEAMGGALEAEAAPGEGAVFTLCLDLPHAGAARTREEAVDAHEAAADPLGGLRVLVAEDHPTNRRVVELILGAAGVDLTCVEDGLQAVEAFRAAEFDLILMDMQMPVMDGLTAIREIRRMEAAAGARRTPIHVLTANAMPEHISDSLAAGADGHLPKPIQANTLLERVAESALAPAHPARFARAG